MKQYGLIFVIATYFCLGLTATGQQVRTEKDLLGSKDVPADAYYGVQTARALDNFKISGTELLDPVKLTGLDPSKYATQK